MIRRAIPALLAAGLCLAAAARPQTPPAVDKTQAARLSSALARIGAAPSAAALRPAEFGEAELNAYIARRLEESREDVLRDLRLKVYPENRVEGWLELDFSRHKTPAWMKKRMNLYFAGRFEVRSGQARFGFDRLFLEKEPMPVMMLDMIVFVASQMGKTDAKGLDDWHDLPRGVRDVSTEDGRFTLWY